MLPYMLGWFSMYQAVRGLGESNQLILIVSILQKCLQEGNDHSDQKPQVDIIFALLLVLLRRIEE